jgi:C_GCAxxG_C_C family probable redox protein
MSKVENAIQCFSNNFNCSQAVFSTYSDQLGLDQQTALKISCPFGGGMGRMGETCGAVTGAYMLIGLKYGKYLPEDNESKEKSYALVREFNERFSKIHGSVVCKELLKYDMNIPEDLKILSEKKLCSTLCPVFVKDAARIIGELLELE